METVEFLQGTLSFEPTRYQPATTKVDAFAVRPEDNLIVIEDAIVFVRGYDVIFLNGDHNLQQVSVNLNVVISDDGKRASVEGQLFLSDSNGDDPFQGTISYGLAIRTKQQVYFAPPITYLPS